MGGPFQCSEGHFLLLPSSSARAFRFLPNGEEPRVAGCRSAPDCRCHVRDLCRWFRRLDGGLVCRRPSPGANSRVTRRARAVRCETVGRTSVGFGRGRDPGRDLRCQRRTLSGPDTVLSSRVCSTVGPARAALAHRWGRIFESSQFGTGDIALDYCRSLRCRRLAHPGPRRKPADRKNVVVATGRFRGDRRISPVSLLVAGFFAEHRDRAHAGPGTATSGSCGDCGANRGSTPFGRQT